LHARADAPDIGARFFGNGLRHGSCRNQDH
jgi:hypothetical protein